MDLATENRLAALLMEEARRLRREADKEGVHVYMQKPNVRGRPNSRFLTATVLGIEQANRAAEISEMWCAREKEKLDAKQKHKSIHSIDSRWSDYPNKFTGPWHEEHSSVACSSSKHSKSDSKHGSSLPRRREDNVGSRKCDTDSYSSYDRGLRDEDVKEFLHSRTKRGRGSIGCRMDEPGPYLSIKSSGHDAGDLSHDAKFGDGQRCRVLGPDKSLFLQSTLLNKGDHVEFDGTWPNKSTKRHLKEKTSKHKQEERKDKKSKHKKRSGCSS